MFTSAWSGAGVVLKPVLAVVLFVVVMRAIAWIVKARRG